jgi:lipoprotein-releasing system permease protein
VLHNWFTKIASLLLHIVRLPTTFTPIQVDILYVRIASYIAKRIRRADDKTRISRPIVRIATAGIAVGMALMLVSMAIVSGFQEQIRNKVIGFGAHFQVTSMERNYSRDSQRLLFNEDVYNELKQADGVKQVQVFATKPGIIESDESMQGVIVKGVDADYDWSFIADAMQEGRVLEPNDSVSRIVISRYLSDRMKLRLGDKARMLFFDGEKENHRQRSFRVCGIFDTGLEDFDKQLVFADLKDVQKLYGWGLRVGLSVDSVAVNDSVSVYALASGGDGDLTFQWSDSRWFGPGPHRMHIVGDTSISLVVGDLSETKPAEAEISWKGNMLVPNVYSTETRIDNSDGDYIGGYEVNIRDYDELRRSQDELQAVVTSRFLQAQKITDRNHDIFAWLEMLDINVAIIILLMVVVSIINMTSALLIIILERQSMIGLLKALGIADGAVMRIFVQNAAWIIGKGMLIGNAVGIGLAFIQWKWSVVSLDPKNYYIDTVPVKFDFMNMLILDFGTLGICILAMVVPALYVLKISPIRAIRFS